MKLHKFISLPIFLSLIVTLSAHGMEPTVAELPSSHKASTDMKAGKQDVDVIVKQAQEYNHTHPLLCLPSEIQQQIAFPWYTNDIKIDKPKMDDLKEVAKTFFAFNLVSKDFHQHFKLPWSEFTKEQKNKMLKKTISCMTVLEHKIYRVVPLLLVYSGADADVKTKLWDTFIHNAVYEDDESAVAMLLDHGANPYQTDQRYNKRLCYCVKTKAMAELFLKKIDNKEELLSNLNCIDGLLGENLSPEIMEFWFDYGVNPGEIYFAGHSSFFHELVRSIDWYGNTLENILAKGEILLKLIPGMINTINRHGETPLDMAIRMDSHNNHVISEVHKALIALLRKHGGKTAQELEEESIIK